MAEHQVMSWLPQHHSYKRDLVSHMEPSVDLEEHFVEVPPVAGSRRPAAQAVRISLTELEGPFSDRLISERHAATGHHLFDISETQREAKVEPDAMTDDFRREPM